VTYTGRGIYRDALAFLQAGSAEALDELPFAFGFAAFAFSGTESRNRCRWFVSDVLDVCDIYVVFFIDTVGRHIARVHGNCGAAFVVQLVEQDVAGFRFELRDDGDVFFMDFFQQPHHRFGSVRFFWVGERTGVEVLVGVDGEPGPLLFGLEARLHRRSAYDFVFVSVVELGDPPVYLIDEQIPAWVNGDTLNGFLERARTTHRL
jgi:hypothetical protein